MFPSGTATKALEDRYADYKEEGRLIDDTAKHGIMQSLINEILETYYSEKESAVV